MINTAPPNPNPNPNPNNLPTVVKLLYQHQFFDDAVLMQISKQTLHDSDGIFDAIAEFTSQTSLEIATALAAAVDYPLLSLQGIDVDQLPMDILGDTFITQHQVLPLLQRNHQLVIALSDPTALITIKEIRFKTSLSAEPVIVPHQQLRWLLANRDTQSTLSTYNAKAMDVDVTDFELADSDKVAPQQMEFSEDDAPIIRFVNKLLIEAIRMNASDIHFEPYDDWYRIRYRIDGVLMIAAEPPSSMAQRINARLKIMAKLDISERRLPQDGKIQLKFEQKRIDFRINTIPTIHTEKIVLRLIDTSTTKLDIQALGLDTQQRKLLRAKIALPQGMVLVTGPTGSGKTVTIYSALQILNQPEVNISTAEDPVEIQLSGINQVPINNKIGLNFAAALRAFLRQDPDIVMIGEIRDLETAEVAVKAAQTGHLVLSTLHTNSAAETLVRLLNIGIEYYNVASTVSLIIAQRLGRRLCTKCKQPIDKQQNTSALLAVGLCQTDVMNTTPIYGPIGCKSCNLGYKGRIGFFEFMDISPTIQQLIAKQSSAQALELAAKDEGMILLRTSALNALRDGITSVQEVQRVTV